MNDRGETSGVILAGGRARRMGGVDKGLMLFAGRPLISYAIEALRPLCREVFINVNRSHERYRQFGLPLIEDTIGGFAGPLAGILAALEVMETPFCLVVPCDAPALTSEIMGQILGTLIERGAEIAMASDGERLHPVVMALRTSLRGSLRSYLEKGGRKIDRWTEGHKTLVVEFRDRKEAFINLNTPEELAKLERLWQDRRF